MTSVNVTTQSNTVTVQQGDATTVTIATQGPQGPAGSSITINNNGTSKVITGSGTANTLNANTNLTFDGTTLDVKSGNGVINAGQGTFNGTVDLSSAESNSSNTSQFKLSNLTIGQHQNVGSYRFANAGTGSFLFTADNINFFNKDVNKNFLRLSASGVELYHDNVKKAETSSTGFDIPEDFIAGSGGKLTVGASGDLTFFHDSANSYIQNNTGDLILGDTNHQYFRGNTSDKSVSLYFNGSEKIKTSADGLNLPDGSKLQFGDSQDLQIYHDTTQSIIADTGTGQLAIRGGTTVSISNAAGTQVMANFINGGACNLFHSGNTRLTTTSSGVTVTGSVTTQDINMSNLNGTANEVDNTKGSWSIQEGADDLFLINRVSGKKYKFNLTEVS